MRPFTSLLFLTAVFMLTSVPLSSSAQAPGAQYLGRGVNLIEGETEPGSHSLIKTLNPEEVEHLTGGSYKAGLESASDVSEAASKYSAKLGMEANYGAFSASADLGFSNEVKERTETKIVMITKDLETATLSLRSNKLNFTDEFKAALNDQSVSPEALFERWGTHITLGVKVGGRVTGVFSSKENSKASNESLEVAAKVGYGGVTGSSEFKSETSNYRKNVQVNEKWIIKGGKPEFKAALERSKSQATYENWARSTEVHPGFYAFTSIRAIWTYADSKTRENELKMAFKYMFTRKSLENLGRFVYTSEKAHKITTQTMTVPANYKILAGGAKANWTSVGNMLTASFPVNSQNWSASHKDHHQSSSSKITLYAVAVHDPFDMLDVRITPTKSAPNTKVIEVSSDGATSQGYAVTGGGSQAQWTGAGSILTGSFPTLRGDAVTGWTSRSMDHMVSSPAQLTSYSISVKFKDPSPYRIETKAFPVDSGTSGHNTIAVGVGYGYSLVGGGAFTSSGGGVTQNFLTASHPERNKWAAESKDHVVSKPAMLRSIAIGLKVIDR